MKWVTCERVGWRTEANFKQILNGQGSTSFFLFDFSNCPFLVDSPEAQQISSKRLVQAISIMPPKGKRNDLRACLVCSILQPANSFLTTGCPNCEDILEVSLSLCLHNLEVWMLMS